MVHGVKRSGGPYTGPFYPTCILALGEQKLRCGWSELSVVAAADGQKVSPQRIQAVRVMYVTFTPMINQRTRAFAHHF